MRPSALRYAALCILPLTCTPLDGRPPADAARSDVQTDAADAPADAPPRDASHTDALAVGDAPACPRAALPSVNTRYNLTLASDTPGDATRAATARAAHVDPMGRILIAGFCQGCTTADRITAAVWRVDAATLRLDTSFGAAGVAADPSPARTVDQWNAVTSDAQGRVYVAGFSSQAPGRAAVVARLLADGRGDPDFGDAGHVRLTRALAPSLADALVATAIYHDGDGTVVALIDQHPWVASATRAWVVRLDDAGALDATFGDGGVREIADANGCFDIARDGDYVFACTSARERPALLRLDRVGSPVAWARGAVAEAASAPARFAVRTLARDSVGRWVVVGPVSASYDDTSALVAAVRFLPDGSHDRTYGLNGVTFFPGPRQSFGYSFASSSRVGCEDRLLVGANYNARLVMGLLDAEGAPIEAIGEYGGLSLPVRAGTVTALVEAIVPVPGTQDVVVVVTHSPSAITLHRVGL